MEEKQLYGEFKQQTGEIAHKKTCICLRKGHVSKDKKIDDYAEDFTSIQKD